ncbi:flagellar hook-associated protein FlgL [Clostridium paraputrificum]|uniref:flagellar hook-associated protein FlgL n=1 Tax=Clostridium TaxID=1485 RepID=UPI003D345231
MRVTNRMLSNNYLRDMRSNLGNMQKLNGQLSSGKEIRRPSDNPFKVARSMQLHTDINTNKQYNENIKDTINYLDATDQALYQATNTMQRIRELMVSAGNAAYGSDERKAIADEMNERVSEITQILNTNFDGKYIFGGTKASSKPLDTKANSNTGNNEIIFVDKEGNELPTNSDDPYVLSQLDMIGSKLSTEISQGVLMDYNVSAKEILTFKNKDGNEINVINLMNDIVNNLTSDNGLDTNKVINENLSAIDDVVNNLLTIRSEVGAKQNRMESAQLKNEDENFNMTDILSKTEDIDFTEKTIEFSMAQTTYIASLQVSAKILPPSLMDYIR